MKKKMSQTTARAPAAIVAAVADLVQSADREARCTRLRMAQVAMERGAGPFEGCHDENGEPLDAETCNAIKRCLVDATAEHWKAIEHVSVAGAGPSLGAWWTRVCRTRQAEEVPSAPRARDVRFLIEISVAENLAAAQARVDELAP